MRSDVETAPNPRATGEFSIHPPPPPRRADLTLAEARQVDARLRDYRDQRRLGRLLRERGQLSVGLAACLFLVATRGIGSAVLLWRDHNFVQLGLPGWLLLAVAIAAFLGAGYLSKRMDRITQRLRAELGEPPWFFM